MTGTAEKSQRDLGVAGRWTPGSGSKMTPGRGASGRGSCKQALASRTRAGFRALDHVVPPGLGLGAAPGAAEFPAFRNSPGAPSSEPPPSSGSPGSYSCQGPEALPQAPEASTHSSSRKRRWWKRPGCSSVRLFMLRSLRGDKTGRGREPPCPGPGTRGPRRRAPEPAWPSRCLPWGEHGAGGRSRHHPPRPPALPSDVALPVPGPPGGAVQEPPAQGRS